jgi:hypothetical protein
VIILGISAVAILMFNKVQISMVILVKVMWIHGIHGIVEMLERFNKVLQSLHTLIQKGGLYGGKHLENAILMKTRTMTCRFRGVWSAE